MLNMLKSLLGLFGVWRKIQPLLQSDKFLKALAMLFIVVEGLKRTYPGDPNIQMVADVVLTVGVTLGLYSSTGRVSVAAQKAASKLADPVGPSPSPEVPFAGKDQKDSYQS